MDQSINEDIIQSMSFNDQTESYIKSQIGQSQSGAMRSQALQQNYMRPKATTDDPLSIISLYAKQMCPPPPEQMVPDRQSPVRRER